MKVDPNVLNITIRVKHHNPFYHSWSILEIVIEGLRVQKSLEPLVIKVCR